MDELLRAHPAALSTGPDELQLDAAIGALSALVANDVSRHTALELLAIDALATGAFVSVENPARLETLANRACAELMALGNGGA
jgi:hypothetical protein